MKSVAVSLLVAMAVLTLADARRVVLQKEESQLKESGAPVKVCSRDMMGVIEVVEDVIDTIIEIAGTVRQELGAFTGSDSGSNTNWPNGVSLQELHQLRSKVDNIKERCWKNL